ncbi:pinin/SDK/memA/ protein conserved region-domain-containing protein [Massariosphaeria phaeospora]|uniref:Pinin/SDK/memA/ protein conserved region-domain-containing protein n=1 Tax=Massariosphaeria phaeospora TaxID=100035 RepID=A0A7C8IF49_9PLEO|nr:pinin/SDK/memA/ protein conserved region-domain-containing protein [Massariosphaeria phaeospora]
MDGPIASAVVIPDEIDLPPPAALSPPSNKRRQSTISEQDAKRARLNGHDANLDHQISTEGVKPPPKPAPKPRERGRERRLFGAALGALSQNSATAAQKRRSEIEKRQQAQRQLAEEESEQRKLERRELRTAQRQKEQKKFERDSMQIRHANLLDMAHFLQTVSEPRLYYKPWEVDPADEERIRNQIAEAKETIRQELDEYEASHKESTERGREVSSEVAKQDADTSALDGKKSNADSQQDPTANENTNGSITPPKDPELRVDHAVGLANEAVSEEPTVANGQNGDTTTYADAADESNKDLQMDETGEEVVEAAEDTVIY